MPCHRSSLGAEERASSTLFMDIYWANAAVCNLPSPQRVEVLVHDGPTDLRPWPGPGPDRDLQEAYGPTFKDVLAEQFRNLGRPLEIGEVLRLHPGKLHCNYLLWIASRGPEKDAERDRAPDLGVLERGTLAALEYARERGSQSIAFGAMGEGPNSLNPEERLATIVRAAHRFHESIFERGVSASLETVRVCDANKTVVGQARRAVGRLAKVDAKAAAAEVSSAAKRTPAAKKPPAPRKVKGLDPELVSKYRAGAHVYDRGDVFEAGEWIVHSRFGVGRVGEVTAQGSIVVLFEDGSTRTMLHARG
jgi:O-acetyl-ADP-ribose deacetylase (regulator of RNase III)